MGRTALPVSGHISVTDFDPAVSFGSKPFWLVYTGSISLRRTRGPAISDFNSRAPAKLYEWDPEACEFKLLAFKDPLHPARCDSCGLTTTAHPKAGRRHPTLRAGDIDYSAPERDCGEWRFRRRNGRLLNPLTCEYMCRDCQDVYG